MQVKVTAKVFLQAASNSTSITAIANAAAIENIAQKKAALVYKEDLVLAPKFIATINKYHLITKVTHH